jgi:hypothetical protein
MTTDELALALWKEQAELGIGDTEPSPELLPDWWANRTLPREEYEAASRGDVAALVRVRTEAGLPVFR